MICVFVLRLINACRAKMNVVILLHVYVFNVAVRRHAIKDVNNASLCRMVNELINRKAVKHRCSPSLFIDFTIEFLMQHLIILINPLEFAGNVVFSTIWLIYFFVINYYHPTQLWGAVSEYSRSRLLLVPNVRRKILISNLVKYVHVNIISCFRIFWI